MIDRARAVAEAGRVADGAIEVGPGSTERVRQGMAEREMGGDGRGEGAAGAVRVAGGMARAACFVELLAVEQHVDDIGRCPGGRP